MVNDALLQIEHNEPSWRIATGNIQLALTRVAGMMGPVRFFADTPNPVEPYYIAPWWDEGAPPELISLLSILRGDFFCAPFGGNPVPVGGIQYPAHGDPANLAWTLDNVRQGGQGVALELHQAQRPQGKIVKHVALVEGHNVVYTRDDMVGMQGPMCCGHHPNLFIPDDAGQGYLSFSPWRYAHTYVKPTERPEELGYSMLRPDTVVTDPTACPTVFGDTTDLTRYPARRGYEDIWLLAADTEGALRDKPFAWTSFALPSQGWVWFSLKNPKLLASTLLWMSNGGRHMPPWSSRNVNCIGIEEITGFFHEGLASSIAPNFLRDMGIPTTLDLTPERPTRVPFIQGVARWDPAFTRVRTIEAADETHVRIVSEEGGESIAQVQWSFAQDGILKEMMA